jgi:predicted nuclease of predicted toxin-antitoxin system
VAKLYADEHFPLPVVELLRQKGHDVLTVQEAGKAGLRIPDDEVLAFATSRNRAVLTLNRYDFKQLHRSWPNHAGSINCSNDRD